MINLMKNIFFDGMFLYFLGSRILALRILCFSLVIPQILGGMTNSLKYKPMETFALTPKNYLNRDTVTLWVEIYYV